MIQHAESHNQITYKSDWMGKESGILYAGSETSKKKRVHSVADMQGSLLLQLFLCLHLSKVLNNLDRYLYM